MIYLGNCRDNIQVIADHWELRLREFLFEKRKRKDGSINGACYYDRVVNRVKCSDVDDVDVFLQEMAWFKNNMRKIVLADEEGLKSYSEVKVSKIMRAFMNNLYEAFTQKKDTNGVSNAHYFFNELNIRTCPYCNRHYTFTLDDGIVKVAPEYDHFYDKAHHPLLAVSFYNLVPSCHSCNHAKGTRIVKINPYFSGFKRKFELQDEQGERMPINEIIKQKNGGRIGFGKLGESPDEKKREEDEQCNINTFGLKGLYEMHDDYINEIVEKTIAYSPSVKQALVDAFQDQAYSPQQVDDFVWGKYLNVAQYEKRPLSKLTRDILEQLGILPDNDFQ